MTRGITYAGTGVNYDLMDPFKREAQEAGIYTARRLRRLGLGLSEVTESRGESVYLIERADHYLAQVEEGLGTKNLVADAMYALTGRSFYDHIAQDTVAMIVNDMITLGAMPLSVAMHLAVGDSNWFNDRVRTQDLIRGWMGSCLAAGCSWGGGETPTLHGIVTPGTVVLSGSAMGIIEPKTRRIRGDIEEGDAIVLITGSGIHANGLTMARKIAETLPHGYLTQLSDGRSYGEALLDPTPIYVSLVRRALAEGINLRYVVNVTGHGWRKLMRARTNTPFTYAIDNIPEPQPVFSFMQEHGPITDEEAYGNLNMGAGIAFFLPKNEVESLRRTLYNDLAEMGVTLIDAGQVERGAETKVVIRPKGIEFGAETLKVR